MLRCKLETVRLIQPVCKLLRARESSLKKQGFASNWSCSIHIQLLLLLLLTVLRTYSLLDVVAVSRASAPSPSTRQTSPVCESQTEARYRAAKSCPHPLQVQPHIYPSTPQLRRSQRTTHVGFYSCTAAAACRSPRPRDGRRSSSTPLPYMPSKSRLAARFSFLSHAM